MSQLHDFIASRTKRYSRIFAATLIMGAGMVLVIMSFWIYAIGMVVLSDTTNLFSNRWLAGFIPLILLCAFTKGKYPFGWIKKVIAYHKQDVAEYEADLWRAARCTPAYYQENA